MPSVFAICGLPGTGKSTLARLLALEARALFVSTEELHVAGNPEDTSQGDRDFTANEQRAAYSLAAFLASRAVECGFGAVVAGVFRSPSVRASFSAGVGASADVWWIELVAPAWILERRLALRQAKGSISPCGPRSLSEVAETYVPLEGGIRISTEDQSPTATLSRVLEHLRQRTAGS